MSFDIVLRDPGTGFDIVLYEDTEIRSPFPCFFRAV